MRDLPFPTGRMPRPRWTWPPILYFRYSVRRLLPSRCHRTPDSLDSWEGSCPTPSPHGETVVVIPGATKGRHAEENVGSMGFTLTPDELRRIDELSRQFL